jgi:hypothetical protein
MTVEQMNRMMREEWRELGFYYDFDEAGSRRRLVGFRRGLFKFRDILNGYADDPRSEHISEHEHYGPYSYLKLMTWTEPGVTGDAICGSLPDFRRLAAIVGDKLHASSAGSTFTIGDEYAGGSKAVLEFEVREGGFDPASADPLLPSDDS